MEYSIYELLWFYLIYSFIGWCAEVCVAAIRKRKFINRGFVTIPLCPIYGTGAVSFCLFLPELKSSPFFLFLGGVILASVIEYSTGKILEKIFKRKWWDYSSERFSLDGYICLKTSLLWGVFALLLLYFVNPLFQSLIGLIPYPVGVIVLLALYLLLLIDFAGTGCTLLGMRIQALSASPISEITEGLSHASRLLENAITQKIKKRMEKAFPTLSVEPIKLKKQEKSTVFAEGCSFYKLFCLFFIGAFLGDITETIFMLITTGKLMSRSSVVYGPFSIVWGLGCCLLTALLYRYRNSSDRHIFVVGTLLGGAYEYICSVFTELVFGTIFWDYSDFAFNLGGRINLLYCFFWGIAAVVWLKIIYPRLSFVIEKIPKKAGTVISNILIVFMAVNMLLSGLALSRYTERNTADDSVSSVQSNLTGQETVSVEMSNALNHFLDTRFPDERMERIYPNAIITKP